MTPNDLDKYERLIIVMKDWADWVQGYRMNIGYPSKSVGMESGYVSASFDDMLDSAEHEMCRLIDAAVDDLPVTHKAAVNRCYGLCAAFRFPRLNYGNLLIEAHETLARTLPKKGVAF